MKKFRDLKKEYANALRVGWFLAFRQIKRSGKSTTGLIIFIMVLTFLNLVVVSGLLVGLISGSFKQYKESYSGDVIITTARDKDYIENTPQVINFLQTHPDVTSFAPRYGIGSSILGTLTENPGNNEKPNSIGIRLSGIDPLKEEELTGFSRFVKYGENLEPGKQGYILIGANMVKQYSSFADANIPGFDLLSDVDIGSKVRVTISTKESEPITKDFIIKGFVKSKVDEISTRAFILDTELKSMLPVNKEQRQEIAVRTTPLKAPQVVAELKSQFGEDSALFQTSEEAIPTFLRDIESTMNVMGSALSSIALVVATITIFIVIFINAVTRRKFIGIMKGIGISPRAVEFSYTIQAFFYGLTGSIIGLLLTFGFLRPYFEANPIDFPFSDGILVATASGAAFRVLILLVVTLIAGYLPAKLIVRKNTLDSILGR